MNNPETRAKLGTRLRTKTNKTKNAKQKTKQDEQHGRHKDTVEKPWCSVLCCLSFFDLRILIVPLVS